MKKALIISAVLATIAVAQADFYINTWAEFGFYDNTGSRGILSTGGDTGIVELFYVGANGVADFEGAGAGTLGDVLSGGSGDDILLGTAMLTPGFSGNVADFSDFAFFDPQLRQGTYAGTGQIFARVYSSRFAEGGIESWYYQGATVVAPDLDLSGTPPTPFTYNLGGGLDGQAAVMGQVIPEPATFGLMGIAALGMFLARKKARR